VPILYWESLFSPWRNIVKKIIGIFAAFFSSTLLFAVDLPFFSGYTGVIENISNSTSNTFAPTMKTDAFLSSQLDFGGVFLVRGEFALKTDDILAKGIFQDTAATFKVNEISATFRYGSLTSSHFFSLFLGNYESIGSDMFLQRQFGIKPITSPVTESWVGLCGATLYPFYGIGGSYVIHFEQPFAVGIYLFANNDEATDEQVFNTDLRFACVLRSFSVDFSAGLAFPHEQSISETGENVVLLVRTETLHAGCNMLIGNRFAFSVFMQAGVSNIDINPEKTSKLTINADDMYLFFEPRIATRLFTANLSAYSIPQESVDNMIYLHDPLGANVSIYTDHLYIENVNFTFGIHTTLSFPGKTFMDIVDDYANMLTWTRNLYVTPFLSIPLFSGTLKFSASANCLSIPDEGFSAFNGTIGYKAQL